MLESITFGIEIECILNENLFEDSDSRQLPKIARYIFKLSDGWKVKGDSSVCSDYDLSRDNRQYDESARKGYPVEITSPPLTGYKGLAEIKRFLTFLNEHAYVNKTCGGHIHIGMNSLFGVAEPERSRFLRTSLHRPSRTQNISVNAMANFAQNVTLIVAALEDGIFSYSGGETRRKNDQYSKMAKSTLRTLSEDKWTQASHDRYRACNLSSIRNHGTVEFRLFAGTVDPYMWIHNILLAIKMAQYARDNIKTPKFLNGITRANFDAVMRFVYGDNTPRIRESITPHADCRIEEQRQKNKKQAKQWRNK